MSSPQVAVSDHDPLMIAWKAYQETDDFKNTLRWAGESSKGELWAAFSQGYMMAEKEYGGPPEPLKSQLHRVMAT